MLDKYSRSFDSAHIQGFTLLGAVVIFLFNALFFDFDTNNEWIFWNVLVIVFLYVVVTRWTNKEDRNHMQSVKHQEWKEKTFSEEELKLIDRDPYYIISILEERDRIKSEEEKQDKIEKLREQTPYNLNKK